VAYRLPPPRSSPFPRKSPTFSEPQEGHQRWPSAPFAEHVNPIEDSLRVSPALRLGWRAPTPSASGHSLATQVSTCATSPGFAAARTRLHVLPGFLPQSCRPACQHRLPGHAATAKPPAHVFANYAPPHQGNRHPQPAAATVQFQKKSLLIGRRRCLTWKIATSCQAPPSTLAHPACANNPAGDVIIRRPLWPDRFVLDSQRMMLGLPANYTKVCSCAPLGDSG